MLDYKKGGINVKVVILGAGANMAKPSITYLDETEEVQEIILADLRLETITDLAKKLKKKVTTRTLDVQKKDELMNVIQGSDLVLNFVGPYYRFGTKVLEASIESGINYIDICDDYDVTIEALKLDEEAKKNGVTAIIGMGSSPGVTNILSRLAADSLDEVEEIHTYWAVGESDPGGFGALLHMFHIIRGEIPTFRNGRLENIRAFQAKDAKTIDFGQELGEVTLYHVGHPEPITLPKYIPGVKTVTNYGALLPEFQNPLFKTLVDFGLTSEEPISFRNEQVKPIEFLLALLQHKQKSSKRKAKKSHISVTASQIEVLGTKGGKKAKYTFTKAGSDTTMATSTSYPIAIASRLILNGDITDKGVLPPEALNPKKLLSLLKETAFFKNGKSYDVVRHIGEEETKGTLFDKATFAELWNE